MKLRVRFCQKCLHDTIQTVVKVMIFNSGFAAPLGMYKGYDGDSYTTEKLWFCPTCGSYWKPNRSVKRQPDTEILVGGR